LTYSEGYKVVKGANVIAEGRSINDLPSFNKDWAQRNPYLETDPEMGRRDRFSPSFSCGPIALARHSFATQKPLGVWRHHHTRIACLLTEFPASRRLYCER